MLLLIGQILRISADGGLALLAAVSEQILVTLDTIRLLLSQDVTMSGQI